MRLTRLKVENFRSIHISGDVRIEPLQAFVGENNSGKSNLLKAVNCFLTSGAGGVRPIDLLNPEAPMTIEAEFTDITANERRRLRTYMLGDRLILKKILQVGEDSRTGKLRVNSEYHGYQAQSTDWWLSIEKIEKREGPRPKWKDIAAANGILERVTDEKGSVNKTSYRKGLEQFLAENADIEYDEPELGQTQALGSGPIKGIPRAMFS